VSNVEERALSWQHLLEALPDATALLDHRGVMHYVNTLLATMTGYTREQLEGQNVQMLVPSRHRDSEEVVRRQHASDPNTRLIWSDRDLTVLRSDGSELSVDFALSPLSLEGRAWAVAQIRDNSERRTAEHALAEAEEHFRLAFEDNMAPMLFLNLDDEIIAANDAFCSMIGLSRQELLGRNSQHFTYPEDLGITEEAHRRIAKGETGQVRYVKRYLRKDGRVLVVEVSKSPARDAEGRTLYFVVSERDITEERALTAQLSHQALHDPLTGLANRALFDDRLAQAHSRILRNGGVGAVLLLDLDEFKGVNDTHGHLVGDQLLIAITRRLEQVTRSSDTLCRFGGDEFLYLSEGLRSPEEAEQLAGRLLESLAAPFAIAGSLIEQHASIGVVTWDQTSVESSEFVQNADVALYEAKRLGKGRFVVFTPDMHQQAVSGLELAQELRQALHAGDILMHFQPIIDLATSRAVGFEALMRWQHPQRGFVPPSVFLPIAEQSDLILELGAFALREVVKAVSSWALPDDLPGERPYVSVNLSAHQFHDPGLVAMVEEAVTKSALSPGSLVIEITESTALVDVSETINVMQRLKRLGVDIALDDFGTGFSSLSYLMLLRPRIIKIDQSFVRPAPDSLHSDALLEMIVSLGHRLEMTMLGEGIETSQQLGRLSHLDCELGQGFLWSPAVPAKDAASMLSAAPEHWGQGVQPVTSDH
jgi:diguanylate cyclase (GGDEF)-like protein/PAS domain S-box-containing protein